ncbi:MAG: PHP domain-containing protein [Succinivibrionaceae bacterium]|nr:PHP domain-containing protein [Succinivibrionaceae bacterium]
MSAIDLHCHSSASDGTLSPTELVERAAWGAMTHLAITDHDTVAGLDEALAAAVGRLSLIPGIEVSTTWKSHQIHIVGLFIDHHAPAMSDLIAAQTSRREERAAALGAALEACGFAGITEAVRAEAGEGAVITRGTYARHLVRIGACATAEDAFKRYLKPGRPCHVVTEWASVAEAVGAIRAAGGVAVIAHPLHYDLSNHRLRQLVTDFADLGGEAMEVSFGPQRQGDADYLTRLCVSHGLLGSMGTDFHAPGGFRDLGLGLAIPGGIRPVWTHPAAAPYHFP